MAIGTLAMCYNNIEVFRGVVKMRRGKISACTYCFDVESMVDEINKIKSYK